MHARTKRTIKAQAYWRQEFGRCAFSGCYGSPLGCHIYPKGGLHAHLSDCKYNGIGLCYKHHAEFDNQGRPPKKLKWLMDNVDPKFRDRVLAKLAALAEIVESHK